MEEVISTPTKETPETSVFKEVTVDEIPEVTILERQVSEGGDRGDEGIIEGPSISEEYEEALNVPNEIDSDDEDDHGITIHAGKLANLTRRTPMRGLHRTPQTVNKENQQAAPQLSVNDEEMKKLRFTRHLTAFDVDINALDDQPWRNRTTDVSDYFNYGFNERTWMDYCEKQLRLRGEKGMGPQSIRDQMSSASVPKNIPTQIPAPSAVPPRPDGKQLQQQQQPPQHQQIQNNNNMPPPGAPMNMPAPPGQHFGMMPHQMQPFQQFPGMPPMPPMPPMPNSANPQGMPGMAPPAGMPMPPFFPGQMPPPPQGGFPHQGMAPAGKPPATTAMPPAPANKPDVDQGKRPERDQERRGGERDRKADSRDSREKDKGRSDSGKRDSRDHHDEQANKRSRYDDREKDRKRDDSRNRKRGRDEEKGGRRQRSRSSSPKSSRRRDDSRDRKRR